MRLWELWGEWFHGEGVPTAQLWGVSVLVWGRLGKVLEFAAGLVVIVDLLDPAKLRSRGAAARQRLSDRRDRAAKLRRQFELDYLRDRLVHSMVRSEHDGEGGAIPEVNRHPTDDFGPYAPFTSAAYAHLRAETLAGLATAHDCGQDHHERVCPAQHSYVWRQVNDFLETYWSDEDRQLIAEAQRTRHRAGAVWLALMPVVAVLLLALQAPAVVTTVAVMVTIAVTTLALLPEGWRLSTPRLWVRVHPAALVGTLLANLLDRARPLHVLRKVALVLFVVGFHFDLLAS